MASSQTGSDIILKIFNFDNQRHKLSASFYFILAVAPKLTYILLEM